MASVNLSGILLNPEGEPDEGAIVKFTLLSTTGGTVQSSTSTLLVPYDGAYDIDLVYGNMRIDYISGSKERFVAIVTINADTVATSLPELLSASTPPTDAQLLQFQALLADSVTAKDQAVTAKNAAETAAATLDLVNDLTLPYVFDTVADMTASVIVFPVGKKLKTQSASEFTNYIVNASGSTNNGDVQLIGGGWAVRISKNNSRWDQIGFSGATLKDDEPNVLAGHSKNHITTDVHSSTISGGGMLNKENVIGGIAANVNTSTSNVPTTPLLGTQSQFCLIGGGYDNVVNGLANVITVGQHCIIDLPADHGSIHGGSNNKILDGSYNTIGGGTRNTVNSDGYGVIAGGGDGWIGTVSTYATISGGSQNEVYGSFSTVSGGQQNKVAATSATSTIGGGSGNETRQNNSTIAGGNGNTVPAGGQGSFIGGGINNTASQECAVVIGGRENEANQNYSQASGYQSKVDRAGQDAFANGMFFVRGDAQTSRIILKGQTGGLQTTTITDVSGGSSFPTKTDIAIGYNIRLVAHDTGAANENALIILEGMASRGASGVWVINSFADRLVSTSALTGVTAEVFDSVGSLRVRVTGVSGASLQWVAHIEYTENKG